MMNILIKLLLTLLLSPIVAPASDNIHVPANTAAQADVEGASGLHHAMFAEAVSPHTAEQEIQKDKRTVIDKRWTWQLAAADTDVDAGADTDADADARSDDAAGNTTTSKDTGTGNAGDQDTDSSKLEPSWGLYTKDSLFTNFALGLEVLPDYDADGSSEGLGSRNFAAKLNFDYVFPNDQHHMFFSVDFSGAPIREPCIDENGDRIEDCTNDNETNISEGKFNDVDSNLALTAGWYWEAWLFDQQLFNPGNRDDTPLSGFDCKKPAGKKIGRRSLVGNKCVKTRSVGPTARVRFISRDQLEENGDSTNTVYSLGVRFSDNQFRVQGFRNGLPRAFVEVSGAHYEDWAGKDDELRLVVAGNYAVFVNNVPIYLGAAANLGSGEDVIALVVSYQFATSRFLDFFSQTNTE